MQTTQMYGNAWEKVNKQVNDRSRAWGIEHLYNA